MSTSVSRAAIDLPDRNSVQYTATANFAAILEHLQLSLLVSTYQAGKLISIGLTAIATAFVPK